jgi:hypothetical protein
MSFCRSSEISDPRKGGGITVDLRLSTAGSAMTAGTGAVGREVTTLTCRIAGR